MRWGAVALLVRPAYIATEFIVAGATTGGYSFLDDSVSDLGRVGCTAAYCSPLHPLMNASFIGFGVLLAMGGLLLWQTLGWASVLLVISGLSSIATGLAPIDQDAHLHTLAATPLFLAQPLALVILAARFWGERPGWTARALLATGVLTASAAAAFVLRGGGSGAGAFERLALWPVLVALAGVGWVCRREPR